MPTTMPIAMRGRPRLGLLTAFAATFLLTLATIVAASAEDAPTAAATETDAPFTPVNADGRIEVTLKNHRFSPAEIIVPAGKPSVILLTNKDETADEFDSTALKVEKVVAGGSSGTIRLRSLSPGRYPFMGEYNAATAQGVVVAR